MLHIIIIFISLSLVTSFSAKPSAAFNINDRFKATCPAEKFAVSLYDANLAKNDKDEDGDSTWVAVFRTNNNLPSVLIKDDFLNAMRIATTIQTGTSSSSSTALDNSLISSQIETSSTSPQDTGSNQSENQSEGVKAQTPVAIGRLSRSIDFPDKFVIDNMRCTLKKEDTNDSCDGNSEHAEAISICIDELILHHLREGRSFDGGAMRMKATIHQGRLLEDRGFGEVKTLSKDMATHVSSLECATTKYSERVVDTVSKGPGARDRALKILNYLGKQDPVSSDDDDNESGNENDNNSGNDDDFDPWATMKAINL